MALAGDAADAVAAPPASTTNATAAIRVMRSASNSARVLRIEATTKAMPMPAMATTPPTSKSRKGPNPNGETIGRQASAATPIASRMRSSVGPTPRKVMVKTPRTWVAR